ncbi:MAG: MbnP family copper-binding protein [Acidobacteriota bacterium]
MATIKAPSRSASTQRGIQIPGPSEPSLRGATAGRPAASCRTLLAAAALCALAGCSAEAPEPLEIRFDARMGEQPARCGERFGGVGTGGGPVELADARFYVSEVELGRGDGTWVPIELDQESPWQHGNVTLLDFEDASGRCSDMGTAQMNAAVRGAAPAGDYKGLRFTFGVPHELNHLDAPTAPTPLNLNALYWNWRLGYIFTKVEFWNPGVDSVVDAAGGASPAETASESKAPDAATAGEPGSAEPAAAALPAPRPTVTYLTHFGSTGCTSPAITAPPAEECSRPNRVTVTLADFDPALDVVALDLAALVDGIDITTSVPRPPGCMSGPADPDCVQVFANLGLDLETGRCADGDCGGQKVASRAAAGGGG